MGSLRERDIEEYLRVRVKAVGGKAYKWVSPGNNGVPDRIVIFPEGKIIFVELKAPGKKPTPIQLKKHRELSILGCKLYVIDSKAEVDELIKTQGGAK